MKKAYFAAGGTAGHINSAISIGEYFAKEGFDSRYISGQRHLDYKLYKDLNVTHLPARPLVGKSPKLILGSLIFNSFCFLKMFLHFLFNRPAFILGAGGYVCGPTLVAGKILGVPVYILEQNSVMGLTNKLLAKISNLIFTNFEKTIGLSESFQNKTEILGNPIRESLYKVKTNELGDTLNVLIFGGSLGANEINDMVKTFLESYSLEQKICILHQTGNDQYKALNNIAAKNIEYKQVAYIDDMAQAYQDAHLVICRGGASSISELKVVRRPSIIIPAMYHADKHQLHNAKQLKSEVEFPVDIHTGQELENNQCELFNRLIKATIERYQTADSSKDFKEITSRPTQLIAEKILNSI